MSLSNIYIFKQNCVGNIFKFSVFEFISVSQNQLNPSKKNYCTSSYSFCPCIVSAVQIQFIKQKIEILRQLFELAAISKFKNGILLPEFFWPTVRKKCSSDREQLLKFEAEGQEFAKFLRSLEQFIQTVKGQNNFW